MTEAALAECQLAFSEEGLVEQLSVLRWKRRMGFLTEWDDVSPDGKASFRADIRQTLLDLKTILQGAK